VAAHNNKGMTMKRYSLSFADSIKHIPEHPERTAKRSGSGMNFDVYYQVWPNRAAMLKTIDIQGKSPPKQTHWRAIQ
jgi:hypothetical protein